MTPTDFHLLLINEVWHGTIDAAERHADNRAANPGYRYNRTDVRELPMPRTGSTMRLASRLKAGDRIKYNDQELTIKGVRPTSNRDENWLDFTNGVSVKVGGKLRVPYYGNTATVQEEQEV